MRVAVFGAGYVGCVTAACLAELGHRVWLVEVSAEKLALLRAGVSPVSEPGLPEALGAALREQRIVPVATAAEAVVATELGLVCVGTPSRADGSPDTAQLRRVMREIALEIAQRPQPYVIALRSTIAVPQLNGDVLPVLKEALDGRLGVDVAFAVHPEFLREGHALDDFRRPPFVIVGTEHPAAAEALKALHTGVDAPFHVVTPGSASLVKYASNAFHAIKVAFANEVASLEGAFGADADAVMRLFCEDRTLNIAPAYLRPGYAFGGSCLPKDLRALTRVAGAEGIAVPVLSSALPSNEGLVQRSVDAIAQFRLRAVTLVGLSFKMGTDDLRESPLVALAERLLGKGYQLRIYDPDVRTEDLRGRNLQYAEEHLHHLTSLLAPTPEAALAGAPLVVIGKPLLPIDRLLALAGPEAKILDLIRSVPAASRRANVYRLDGNGVSAPAAAQEGPRVD